METFKVKIYPTAKQDLLDIVEYLNTLSPEAALRIYDKITDEILSLARMEVLTGEPPVWLCWGDPYCARTIAPAPDVSSPGRIVSVYENAAAEAAASCFFVYANLS